MKTKIFLGAALLSSTICAETSGVDVLLYYAPIDYGSQSFRKDGMVTGIYGAFRSASGYVWEVEGDKTRLRYQAGNDLDQTDITLAMTRHWQNSRSYRFGVHAISSDDNDTDEGFTLFAGLSRYKIYSSFLAGNLYYTRYPNSDLQVWQASSKAGKYWTNPIFQGSFLFQAQLNLIALDEKQADTNSYLSAEGGISWFYNSVSLSLSAWGGSQRFPVRNDGFIVYNLSDKFNRGFKFQGSYALTKNSSIKLGVSNDKITENTGVDTTITVYSLSLGYTF